MSRVKDVDTVAPDDPIVNPQPSSPKKTVTSVTLSAPVVEAVVPEEVVPELAEKIYSVFGHTTTPFSSSLVMPKIFSFTEKNDNETILLALRSHWFTNVPWVLTFIVMLFVPNLIGFVPTISLAANLKIIISLSWYLITFAYAFEQFLSWYFDVFIVTDHRVVDIDFNNLLDKKFSEADLARIQDVTSRVSGVSQTIFNYGTVLIQTAAEKNELVFEKVPNPDKIVKVLQDLRHVAEKDNNGGLE